MKNARKNRFIGSESLESRKLAGEKSLNNAELFISMLMSGSLVSAAKFKNFKNKLNRQQSFR